MRRQRPKYDDLISVKGIPSYRRKPVSRLFFLDSGLKHAGMTEKRMCGSHGEESVRESRRRECAGMMMRGILRLSCFVVTVWS